MLRPAGAAAVPRGGEGGRARRCAAPVYSHLIVRHRARRGQVVAPARHPHRRGPQRAAAGARPGGAAPLVSDYFDFSIYVDARWTTSAGGTSSASSRCGARPSPTALLLPPVRAGGRRRGPRRRRERSGARSTSPTSCRTSCPPAPGPPWYCRRAPTTGPPGAAAPHLTRGLAYRAPGRPQGGRPSHEPPACVPPVFPRPWTRLRCHRVPGSRRPRWPPWRPLADARWNAGPTMSSCPPDRIQVVATN